MAILMFLLIAILINFIINLGPRLREDDIGECYICLEKLPYIRIKVIERILIN